MRRTTIMTPTPYIPTPPPSSGPRSKHPAIKLGRTLVVGLLAAFLAVGATHLASSSADDAPYEPIDLIALTEAGQDLEDRPESTHARSEPEDGLVTPSSSSALDTARSVFEGGPMAAR